MDPIFKARWMMMFGAAFTILGFSGRTIIPPEKVSYDVCGVGIAVGIVLFIQGFVKMRAAIRAEDEPEEHGDQEPPGEK